MSIEFRLKYIREAIDKNINDILLKWNAKKVLLNESFDEDIKDLCPVCTEAGKQCYLKYCYVNMDEAVYKCESTACLYPFRNFKYKNYADRTIFRYERIMETARNKSEQQIFTSPTKIESDDMDHFNISWLDDSDLDSILSAPTEGQTCDIKEIMDNICNNEGNGSITSNSQSRIENGQLSKEPAPKLSKCLQYIEHLSPGQQSNSNKVETATPTKLIANDGSLKKSTSKVASLSGFKSFKKSRKMFKNNGNIKPVQSIVDQRPLAFLEWLDVVSKIEPKQIQEFEFTSPAEYSDITENHMTNNTQKSSESAPTNTTPILIELMGTPESYASDGNKLPGNRESCLLYQLDPNELQTTGNEIELPIVHSEDQITTKELEDILSGDQIHVSSVSPNVDHSCFVSEESSSIQIIESEIGTDSKISQKDPALNGNVQMMRLKAKKQKTTKIDAKVKKRKRKLEDKKTEQQRKLSRKTFNIKVEERFLGFEAMEPFKPITLRKKELIWLKIE